MANERSSAARASASRPRRRWMSPTRARARAVHSFLRPIDSRLRRVGALGERERLVELAAPRIDVRSHREAVVNVRRIGAELLEDRAAPIGESAGLVEAALHHPDPGEVRQFDAEVLVLGTVRPFEDRDGAHERLGCGLVLAERAGGVRRGDERCRRVSDTSGGLEVTPTAGRAARRAPGSRWVARRWVRRLGGRKLA